MNVRFPSIADLHLVGRVRGRGLLTSFLMACVDEEHPRRPQSTDRSRHRAESGVLTVAAGIASYLLVPKLIDGRPSVPSTSSIMKD